MSLVTETRIMLIVGALIGFTMVNLLGAASAHQEVVELLHLHEVSEYVILVVFFYLIGVEVKDEMKLGGKLHGRKAILPMFAALGGSVMPGLIAVFASQMLQIEGFHPVGAFASSVATDIVFATLPLALLKVPLELRIFVLTAAVADDVYGVLALLGAESLAGEASVNGTILIFGVVVIAAFAWFLRYRSVQSLVPWLVIFAGAWLTFFWSGIEQALCWFAIPFFAPEKVVKKVEHALKVPLELAMGLFAFTAAGVSLQSWGVVSNAMTAAWTIGKPVGFVFFTLIGAKLFRLQMPMSMPNLITGGFAMAIPFTVASIVAGITFHDEVVYAQVISAALVTTAMNIVVTFVVYFITRPWHRQSLLSKAAVTEQTEFTSGQ